MSRIFCALALASSLSLAAGLSAATPQKPFDLLEGKTLAAWELVAVPAVDVAVACQFNADGSLAVAGKPVSYLATKSTYENYQLHAEWRWPANAAKNSNSGVLLHIASGPANGTAWPRCFQVQLKPGRAGDMLPMNEAKFAEPLSTPPAAKTPQLDRAAADSEKPLGEWNSCVITCRGGTIEVVINGVRQSRISGCTPATGRIGFQLEGTPFELRNVRLTPLR